MNSMEKAEVGENHHLVSETNFTGVPLIYSCGRKAKSPFQMFFFSSLFSWGLVVFDVFLGGNFFLILSKRMRERPCFVMSCSAAVLEYKE